MSQPDRPMIARTTRCEICHERSTWDFLRDFYLRVESVDERARKLEYNLEEAMYLTQRLQRALNQCEASLIASWETINQERLDYRASQEALTFERERHKETIEMLEKVFKEAVRSGEIADSLRSQIDALKAASNSGIVQAVPRTMASMEAPLGEENSTPSDASTSANRQRDSAKRLLETCASGSSRPKHSGEDERQQAARPDNVDPSEDPEHKCCFPHDAPLQSMETQSSTSDVTGFASAMEGADGYGRSKMSSETKKRTGHPVTKELRKS